MVALSTVANYQLAYYDYSTKGDSMATKPRATKEEQIAKIQAKLDKIEKTKRENERLLKAVEQEGSISAASRKVYNHKIFLVGGSILQLAKTDKTARNAVIKALDGIKNEADKEAIADLLAKLKSEADDAKAQNQTPGVKN